MLIPTPTRLPFTNESRRSIFLTSVSRSVRVFRPSVTDSAIADTSLMRVLMRRPLTSVTKISSPGCSCSPDCSNSSSEPATWASATDAAPSIASSTTMPRRVHTNREPVSPPCADRHRVVHSDCVIVCPFPHGMPGTTLTLCWVRWAPLRLLSSAQSVRKPAHRTCGRGTLVSRNLQRSRMRPMPRTQGRGRQASRLRGTQRTEERPEVPDQQVRLFDGREMAAGVEYRPMGDVVGRLAKK